MNNLKTFEDLTDTQFLDRHSLYIILKQLGFHPYSVNHTDQYKADTSTKKIFYYYDDCLNSWAVLFKTQKAYNYFQKFAYKKLPNFNLSGETLPKEHEFNFLLNIQIGKVQS